MIFSVCDVPVMSVDKKNDFDFDWKMTASKRYLSWQKMATVVFFSQKLALSRGLGFVAEISN
jgi:hypothetical protein